MKTYISVKTGMTVLLFFCLSLQNAFSQSNPFKKVGNDLPAPALYGCTDNNGQLYALCATADSVQLFTFLSGPQQWLWKASLKAPNFLYDRYADQSVSCFFHDTSFYMNVTLRNDSTRIYRKAGRGFKRVAVLHNKQLNFSFTPAVRSIEKRNGDVFLFGQFDKIQNGADLTGAVKFNGTTFSAASMDVLNEGCLTFQRNDTIFYIRYDEILAYHIPSNTESVYYKSPHIMTSLTGSAGYLYYSSGQGGVYTIRKNTLVDSAHDMGLYPKYVFNTLYGNLFYMNGRLMYMGDMAFANRRELYFKNGKALQPMRTPDFVNDNDLSNIKNTQLVKGPGSDIYMISGAEKILMGTRYNIARFNPDSLNTFGYDTIRMQVFGDLDKNGVISAGDDKPGMGLYVMSEQPFAQFQDGLETFILPNYRTYSLRAIWDFFAPSCYEMPVNGYLTTKNMLPGKTVDTLMFPMVLKSSTSVQVARFAGSSRARLNDTVNNIIRVYDKACSQPLRTSYLKVVLEPLTTLISSKPAYMSKKGDTIIFKIDSLGNDMIRTISFKTKYSNSSFSIPDTVQHKLLLTESATSNQKIKDIDSLSVRLVYSYDPNEKVTEQPKRTVLSDFNMLKYTIHFQNEGNDEARDVVITDTLDSRLDPKSIQTIYSSHNQTMSLNGNTVTWTFKNINLTPKSANEAKSQGYVVFEIRKKTALKVGDSLRNKAQIFFDLNPPVITNYATVRMVEETEDTSGTGIDQQLLARHGVLAYPNPAAGELHLSNSGSSAQMIIVRDMTGKELFSVPLDAGSSYVLNIGSLARGMYLLEVAGTGSCIKLVVR